MKQKIVIKVPINGQKSRTKALKIAVTVQGVESAALQGQDKNQIEVVGDGIDAVGLTSLLRKSVGFAEILSVTPVGEKDGDKKPGGGDTNKLETTVQSQPPLFWSGYPYGYGGAYGNQYVYGVKPTNNDPDCCIM